MYTLKKKGNDNMKKILLLVIVMILLLSGNVLAEDIIDSGEFIIKMGGQEIGSEVFSFSNNRAVSDLDLVVHGQEMIINAVLKGEDGLWQNYSLEIAPTYIDVNFTEEKTLVNLEQFGKEQKHQLAAIEPVIVLDNNIFSHYQILLSNYAPEDRFEFKAIVPSVLQMFDCSLQYRGQEVYQINEENSFLHKYILILGDRYL